MSPNIPIDGSSSSSNNIATPTNSSLNPLDLDPFDPNQTSITEFPMIIPHHRSRLPIAQVHFKSAESLAASLRLAAPTPSYPTASSVAHTVIYYPPQRRLASRKREIETPPITWYEVTGHDGPVQADEEDEDEAVWEGSTETGAIQNVLSRFAVVRRARQEARTNTQAFVQKPIRLRRRYEGTTRFDGGIEEKKLDVRSRASRSGNSSQNPNIDGSPVYQSPSKRRKGQ